MAGTGRMNRTGRDGRGRAGTGRIARLRPSPSASAPLLLITILLTACRVSFSPLQNRIEFGREAFLVFAATGEGGLGDLYAVKPDGGEIWPVTYTRLDERLPGLSRDGLRLAFVRRSGAEDAVVVMDLAGGSEERVLETASDSVVALTWRPDGELWVRGSGEAWRIRPGAEPAALGTSRAIDSAFSVLVGEPAFATVTACDTPPGLCARAATGESQVLEPGGRHAVRWGSDSVGYFLSDRLYVRPLGPGRERFLRWHPEPVAPRTPTLFEGR